MILLDQPYVSDFLKQTIVDEQIPVITNEASQAFQLHEGTVLISEQEAIKQYERKPFLIYTNSENAIDWVNSKLHFSDLPHKVEIFKDKFKFRELTSEMLPEFFYKEYNINELAQIKYSDLPQTCVLKPVVGFFSLGVYMIEKEADLINAVKNIHLEVEHIKSLYPVAVLDTNRFIIEEYLEGEEFAFDAFYDANGKPSVVGIMKHLFGSSDDVGDRVYFTSKEIIQTYVPIFEQFLVNMGKLVALKNYPLHVEVRINSKGDLLPIEVNPLRTGGWCTSADLAHHAFNYNPISHILKQQKPNWTEILKNSDDRRYSIVILTNTTGIAPAQLKEVNYDAILAKFEDPLELRKSDFNKQPHFGFLFTATSLENWNEIEQILVDDLSLYVSKKD